MPRACANPTWQAVDQVKGDTAWLKDESKREMSEATNYMGNSASDMANAVRTRWTACVG